MELEHRKAEAPVDNGLTMQRNKVHHVRTVERLAKDLGVYEDLIPRLRECDSGGFPDAVLV